MKSQYKGQNRVEYIVLHNPDKAAELVDKYGYQAPDTKAELVMAVKHLVRRKGEPFTRDLLEIHPDREALKELGCACQHSNYCGCGHSSFNDGLQDITFRELEVMYEEAKQKSRDNPDDKTLVQKAQDLWDQMKNRQQKEGGAAKKPNWDELLPYIGASLLIGFVIGTIMASRS